MTEKGVAVAFAVLYHAMRDAAEAGEPKALGWIQAFARLRAEAYEFLAACDVLPF